MTTDVSAILAEMEHEIDRVLGPYEMTGKNAGRKFVILMFKDGTRKSTSNARWLMEQTLGRKLHADEHVDHINDDPTDDRLANLQILSPLENNRKSAKPAEMVLITCVECHQQRWKLARYERHNRGMGKAGPFCDKRCSFLWQVRTGKGAGGAKKLINWPPLRELEEKFGATSYAAIGRELGCTGEAVRAHMKKQRLAGEIG